MRLLVHSIVAALFPTKLTRKEEDKNTKNLMHSSDHIHVEGTSPGKEGEHSGTLLWGKHCIACVYESGCAVNKSRPTL